MATPGSSEEFGDRVRKAREGLGASRADIARLLDMPLQRYKMIEFNALRLDDLADTLPEQLAKILRCPIRWLRFGGNERNTGLTANVVAQRSERRRFTQQDLWSVSELASEYGTEVCSDCGNRFSGSRCGVCGRYPGM